MIFKLPQQRAQHQKGHLSLPSLSFLILSIYFFHQTTQFDPILKRKFYIFQQSLEIFMITQKQDKSQGLVLRLVQTKEEDQELERLHHSKDKHQWTYLSSPIMNFQFLQQDQIFHRNFLQIIVILICVIKEEYCLSGQFLRSCLLRFMTLQQISFSVLIQVRRLQKFFYLLQTYFQIKPSQEI